MQLKVLGTKALAPKLAVVVGTRPGIIMFAPIIAELVERDAPFFLIHTGQHYSPNMDSDLFEDLELPHPDFRIKGVSEYRTHAGQTARMMTGIEEILLEERPAVLVVGGDANTNLAGALAARKLGIQIAHVEAGERSYDWRMPEEHNRRMIDHISETLFATGEKAKETLLRENVPGEVHVTGNPIVDASQRHFAIAKARSTLLEDLGLLDQQYGVMTLHREENVDFIDNLKGAIEGVSRAAESMGMAAVFVAHPRTRKRIREFDLEAWVDRQPRIMAIDAVSYLHFLRLLVDADVVWTDSGGVQQEACIHQVPGVTLRDNTEWTETLEIGANRLAGTDPSQIVAATSHALSASVTWSIPFGDGNARKRIADVLTGILSGRQEASTRIK